MSLRAMTAASLSVAAAGIVLLYLATVAFAASQLPHGYGGAGEPYYGGQVLDNNYTYYTYERDQGMDSWQFATARRYIDGWQIGQTMTQYVVYSGSQQDTDLANWFGVTSCAAWDNLGFSAYRSFVYGHGSLNNDSLYTVICLNVTALGYPVGYDQVDQPTRVRGMTHEMGHSLHLDHDADGVMCMCWSYDINSSEAQLVNTIYSSRVLKNSIR